MKQRIIVAVVCVPLIFIILFFLPPYALAVLMAVICAVAAYELLHAIGAKDHDRIAIYAVISAIIIPVGEYFEVGAHVFRAVFLILMSVMFVEAVLVFRTKNQIDFAQILTALFGGAVIPYFLSSLISLRIMPGGHLLALFPIICAFVTDAGAYFTGVFLGKRRAFPLVSPKKTVEGCIGGIAAGTAAMLIYGAVLALATPHRIVFWALLLYGIIGAAVTELGDLAFSLVKREFGIKDYGRLIPGHGGVLDRFDSMVFTAPAIYLLVTAVPAVIVAPV